jgi:hypothetical protein
MLIWERTVETATKKMKMDVVVMRQVLHKSRKGAVMVIVKIYRRAVMPKYPNCVVIGTYLKVFPACYVKMMLLKVSYCYRFCHRDGISRTNRTVELGIMKMRRRIVMIVTKVKSIGRVDVKVMLILEMVGCSVLIREEMWR